MLLTYRAASATFISNISKSVYSYFALFGINFIDQVSAPATSLVAVAYISTTMNSVRCQRYVHLTAVFSAWRS